MKNNEIMSLITNFLTEEFDIDSINKEKIYPVLKPIEYLDFGNETLYTPYNSELIITYVFDSDSAMMFITKSYLELLQITLPELHETAMTNFLRDKDIPLSKVEVGCQKMYAFDTGDCYDATRLLLSHRIQDAVNELKGRAILSIPSRDGLYILPNRASSCKQLKRLTENLFRKSSKPISNNIYTFHKGELLKYAG